MVPLSQLPFPRPPQTVEEATTWLAWLSMATVTGVVDSRTARETTLALRGFLAGRTAADKVNEKVRRLEETLRKLERTGEDG